MGDISASYWGEAQGDVSGIIIPSGTSGAVPGEHPVNQGTIPVNTISEQPPSYNSVMGDYGTCTLSWLELSPSVDDTQHLVQPYQYSPGMIPTEPVIPGYPSQAIPPNAPGITMLQLQAEMGIRDPDPDSDAIVDQGDYGLHSMDPAGLQMNMTNEAFLYEVDDDLNMSTSSSPAFTESEDGLELKRLIESLGDSNTHVFGFNPNLLCARENPPDRPPSPAPPANPHPPANPDPGRPNDDLSAHLRRQPCRVCGVLVSKANLNRHISTIHNVELKTFILRCEKCGATRGGHRAVDNMRTHRDSRQCQDRRHKFSFGHESSIRSTPRNGHDVREPISSRRQSHSNKVTKKRAQQAINNIRVEDAGFMSFMQ